VAAYVKDAGKKTATGFSGTTDGSFATLPSVNNHVVVCVSCYDGDSGQGLSTVTDNQGSNTYAGDATGSEATTGDCFAAIWSCKVAASSGTFTITIDPVVASGLYAAWTAVEFSGLDTTTHKDQTGNNNNTAGDANATAGGVNTTTGGVAVACASVSNSDTDINISDTPPTGYTNIQFEEDALNVMGFASVYKVYSSSETSSATFTHDNTSQSGWAAAIVTYKDAGGGGGGRTTRNTRNFPLGEAAGMGFMIH
jgi:hypothetical protein